MSAKKEFALIGYPLGHSRSPEIHRLLMEAAGIDGAYTCREVTPDALGQALFLKELDGYNVTIPHKTAIIPYLDTLSAKAELFGAVNTVQHKKGKSIGHNTDCEGFLRALDGAGTDLGGDVLVLGSGGVSRMFAFESVLHGAQVTIAARNTVSALTLKKEIKEKTKKDCRIVTLSTVGGAYDLIINGTPVGMHPHVEESPIPAAVAAQAGAVFDAVYNPQETLLLRYAREAGVPCLNGLSMLVWQAAVAQEIWNGVKFNDSVVNGIIEQLAVSG